MANFFSASFWKARFFKAFGGQAAADPGAMSGTFAGSSSWTGTLFSAATAERKTIDLVFVPDPADKARDGRWIRPIPQGDEEATADPVGKKKRRKEAPVDVEQPIAAAAIRDAGQAAVGAQTQIVGDDDEDLILALLLAA